MAGTTILARILCLLMTPQLYQNRKPRGLTSERSQGVMFACLDFFLSLIPRKQKTCSAGLEWCLSYMDGGGKESGRQSVRVIFYSILLSFSFALFLYFLGITFTLTFLSLSLGKRSIDGVARGMPGLKCPFHQKKKVIPKRN